MGWARMTRARKKEGGCSRGFTRARHCQTLRKLSRKNQLSQPTDGQQIFLPHRLASPARKVSLDPKPCPFERACLGV